MNAFMALFAPMETVRPLSREVNVTPLTSWSVSIAQLLCVPPRQIQHPEDFRA